LLLDTGFGFDGTTYRYEGGRGPRSRSASATASRWYWEGTLSKGLNGVGLGSTGRVAGLGLGGFLLAGVITSFPEQGSWGTANQLGQNGMIGIDVLRRLI
jgi:hypothetical protein